MVRLISVTVVFSSVCVRAYMHIYACEHPSRYSTLISCACMHVRTYNGVHLVRLGGDLATNRCLMKWGLLS